MNNFLYSEKYNLIYISNPKVACSTIKNSLLDNIGDKVSSGAQLHDIKLFKSPVQFTDPIFTVVRNPYSRAMSCFIDKIGEGKDPSVWDPFKKKYGITKDITFLTYLNILAEDTDILGFDPHFKHQYLNTWFNDITPEFLGKLEDMKEVANYLKNKGITIYNYIPHQTNSQQKKEFKKDEVKLIEKIYERDFECFDYPMSVEECKKTKSKYYNQEVSELYKEFVYLNRFGLTVDNLRELAIKKETEDLQYSYKLMTQAYLRRPNGPVIRKKLEAYSERLNLKSDISFKIK